MTIALGRSAVEEAREGVALELTLHDGPLILTLTRDEARALATEITDQLAPTREVP
jgi:hypothetical protein